MKSPATMLSVLALLAMTMLIPTAAHAKCGALVVSIESNGTIDGDAVIPNFPNCTVAARSAMELCERHGGSNCQVKLLFHRCAFISIGYGAPGSGNAWGAGFTRRQALQNCRMEGVTCRRPQGHCNSR